MADDKKKRYRDRLMISLTEDDEVHYWTRKLGVTKNQLAEAVQAVGPSARKIDEYLQQNHPETVQPAAEWSVDGRPPGARIPAESRLAGRLARRLFARAR